MDREDLDPPVTKGAFGIILLLLLIAGGAFPVARLLTSDGSTSEAVPVTEAPASAAAEEAPATTEAPAPSTTAAEIEAQDPTTSTEAPYVRLFETQDPSGLFDLADPIRRAVMKGGVVYLGGEVQSAQDADTIAAKVAKVVGPDNVYMEYRLNPDAPLSNEGVLEVADLVLFESGSAVLRREFTPLLDLGVALMAANPGVTIHVLAHTDTDGPAPDNLSLSQLRAQAIVDYWIASGIDAERVSGEGKGETQPIADESEPGGAQLNRRAEFLVRGLLD